MTLAGARLSDREVEIALQSYAGLIHETARMLVDGRPPYGPPVEEDVEDVVQILYVKAWRAIKHFDPARWKGGQQTRHASHGGLSARDRYVNMCIRDQAKDVQKRKRRGELFIEDIAPITLSVGEGEGNTVSDQFHARYLSTDHEQVYGDVDDGEVHLPNTLSERERAVVDLMRGHFRQTEIADVLGITKREVESAVRSIRAKMADWRPTSREVESVPQPSRRGGRDRAATDGSPEGGRGANPRTSVLPQPLPTG